MQDVLPSAKIYNDNERRIFTKVTKKLIPFLVLLFLLAWIDRVNVGFAKLSMLNDLKFSETAYGLGAGVFFIKLHCAIAGLLGAIGLCGTGLFIDNFYMAILFLTMAAIGIISAFPVFWTIPTMFLGSTAAAGGLAFINSVGNLAGFVAPYLMGFLKTATGSLSSGLYFVAFLELMAFTLTLVIFRNIKCTSV